MSGQVVTAKKTDGTGFELLNFRLVPPRQHGIPGDFRSAARGQFSGTGLAAFQTAKPS